MFLRISISCILIAMIFFDATGQRWRKIKLSAAGVAALVATPAILLGIGTLVYQPKWGQLPIISQAQSLVNEAANLTTQQVAAATHPSPSPSPSRSNSPKPATTHMARAATAKTVSAATPAPTLAPAVLSAQTHNTPHASATPTPVTAPTTAPGNSGGHSKGTPSPKH